MIAAPAVLVTGTDTGVGKTLVSTAIVASLTERGFSVGVYKPVETGCEVRRGQRIGRDCERLRAAAGGRQDPASVASYLLELPAAPLVAARAESVTIDIDRLARDYAAVASSHDVTVVEGAGGLLVPITDAFTTLDLARRLALPVLVVVGSRLGCINHALLTLSVLEARDVGCAGFIVNCVAPDAGGAASPSRNRETIAAFTSAPDLGLFPHVAPERRDDYRHLARLATEKIGSDPIFPGLRK